MEGTAELPCAAAPLGGTMLNILSTIAQRVALGLLTLFIVSLLIFLAVEMLPGDFARAVLGQSATPETVAAFQHQIGLDRPAGTRYVEWLAGVLHGDLGQSYAARPGYDRPVAAIIGPRLENTLFLAGLTALIAVPLALVLGAVSALWRNSLLDRALNAATLTTISVPEFFVAYVLILLLSVHYPLFPSLANISQGMSLGESLVRVALPIITLTLVIMAHMMRMTRAAIIGVLSSPYIEMAQLKGIPPRRIILHHALRNAWAPIINVIAFNLAYLIVGVVVIETVFVYPGIGQVLVDAVRARDLPVVQACTLIFAFTYIVLNLLADIIAIVSNPRLLHPK